MLYDEVIGHMREAVTLPEPGDIHVIERKKPDCAPSEYKPYEVNEGKVAPLAAYGDGHRFHVTGLYHAADGFPTSNTKLIHETNERLVHKIDRNKETICKNEEFYLDDAEIGIFAYGVCAKSAKFAVKELRSKGIKVGLLRPLTIWPFPDDAVEEMAKKVKTIIVPEMNLGQVFYEVQRASKGQCDVRGLFRVDTDPIHPKQIMNAILGKPVEPTVIPSEVLIERDMLDG
ncbi:MAG: hypothetical protein HZC45_01225 [Deltaproteobacteria bacterium]|nr:hypothetical protein [Deltaproteobacteria bacterium]